MNTINDGGPAFPGAEFNHEFNEQFPYAGMTLRDYFAAKALQGTLADSKIGASSIAFARNAYAIADAMLEARGSK